MNGYIESAIIARDAYNKYYDLGKNSEPEFNTNSWKEEEITNRPKELYDLMYLFIDKQVYKNTGITLDVFMTLSPAEIDLLLLAVIETDRVRGETTEEELEEILNEQ